MRGTSAGFFGSAAQLPLLPGRHIDPGGVSGYYIDLSMKPTAAHWPPDWLEVATLYVTSTQWGLGSYERHLNDQGNSWLDATVACGRHLLDCQASDGSFRHLQSYPHTFDLSPPWVSGIAQGQAASLFVRLFRETADQAFADAARLALRPLRIPSSDGGDLALLDDSPWPEEYPTQPPSFVLNGGIFAIWGYRDVALGLGDPQAEADFEEAVDTLARNLHRWDTGFWSRYDLFPHPLVNVASSAYHLLHISQLQAMNMVAPRPEISSTLGRFESYWRSRSCRARAFAAKAAFRLRVPRRS